MITVVSGLIRNWKKSEQYIEASTKNMEELSEKSPGIVPNLLNCVCLLSPF